MDMSESVGDGASGTADAFGGLSPNPDWRSLPLFDRSGWSRVRFGDVVQNVNETERDPAGAGLERFIGLEHLEPGSLHVRSWGNVADGTTFTRRCRPGQVLFGKRRAYQRKVAVAEFDAVVSGDIYVLAPKDGRLLPELLPFICLSERFYEHAVGTSAGSLSPRTNWSSLAGFEFDLPPLEAQRRIAEVLWAVDEAIDRMAGSEGAVRLLIEAKLDEFLYDGASWPLFDCRDLFLESPKNGFSPQTTSDPAGIPTLSISAIRDGKVAGDGNLKYANVQANEVDRFRLYPDDILIVRGNGNRYLCGCAGVVEQIPEGCFYPDLLIRLRFRDGTLLPKFAVLQWNEKKTHTRLLSKAKSTNGIWKINGKDVQSHILAVPPIDQQQFFLNQFEATLSVGEALRNELSKLCNLQRSVMNVVMREIT